MINVKYDTGEKKLVDCDTLDDLIVSQKIIAFQRHDGWVEINKARLRNRPSTKKTSGKGALIFTPFQNLSRHRLAEKVKKLEKENRFYREINSDLRCIIRDSNDAIIRQRFDGMIISWNLGAEKIFGYTEEEVIGKNIVEIVPEGLRTEYVNLLGKIKNGEVVASSETQRLTREGNVVDVWLTITKIEDGTGEGGVVTTERDITERIKKEKENEQLIASLKGASAEIKTLRGFIPICASCKNVRDETGCWRQVEAFVTEHTYAEFSHGICPKCLEKLYPDFKNDKG